jgi:hypothetical protein
MIGVWNTSIGQTLQLEEDTFFGVFPDDHLAAQCRSYRTLLSYAGAFEGAKTTGAVEMRTADENVWASWSKGYCLFQVAYTHSEQMLQLEMLPAAGPGSSTKLLFVATFQGKCHP